MGVFERLQRIISKELAIDGSKIKLGSRFEEDLNADSLNRFAICAGLEEEFELEVDGEAAMEAETVQELVELINPGGE